MSEEKAKKTLNIDETIYETEVPESYGKKWIPADEKLINAFIPGTIIDVRVKAGQEVTKDQVLLILDAMKMYNEITAPVGGVVDVVAVSQGERIEKNQLLIRLK